MKQILLLPLLGLALLCGACSTFSGTSEKDALAKTTWSYAPDALSFDVIADSALNRYNDTPHTLLLGIYESADAQAFGRLLADPVALARSMESGTAGAAFLQLSRYVVMPGQHSIFVIDRAQNTRYVGVVAGYAQLNAPTSVRQFEILAVTTHTGWISKDYAAAAGPLAVRITLGAQGIVDAKTQPHGPDAAQLKQARLLDGGGKEILLSRGVCRGAEGSVLSGHCGPVPSFTGVTDEAPGVPNE
jgi:type VI secretion system VasD/TssJ family lipoprotein